jgi:hypothetical protein
MVRLNLSLDGWIELQIGVSFSGRPTAEVVVSPDRVGIPDKEVGTQKARFGPQPSYAKGVAPKMRSGCKKRTSEGKRAGAGEMAEGKCRNVPRVFPQAARDARIAKDPSYRGLRPAPGAVTLWLHPPEPAPPHPARRANFPNRSRL